MALHENVLAALVVKEGKLVYWKMKKGIEMPKADEMGALIFQRSLIHGLLKAREEYVGRMHYNLTVYDQGEILHFGLKDTDGKEGVLLVAVNPPYDRDEFVAKVLRLLTKK
jgi:hypothetical protein